MAQTQNGVLKRDDNMNPVMGGTSSADNATIINASFDPVTRRLRTDAGSGVDGPGTSTDNAIVRFDGTTGDTIQNSVVLISDTGAVTGVTTIVASGAADFSAYKVAGVSGASGSFTTVDLKTVTVVGGIITSIV